MMGIEESIVRTLSKSETWPLNISTTTQETSKLGVSGNRIDCQGVTLITVEEASTVGHDSIESYLF